MAGTIGEGPRNVKQFVVAAPSASCYDADHFAGRFQVMPWVYLFVAGLMEVGWAIGLKYTEGFSRLGPTVWTVVTMILSLFFLGQSLKTLPVGTAYAVWTGIGAVGAAVLGIILFGDSKSAFRLISIGLIVAGIAGLRISA